MSLPSAQTAVVDHSAQGLADIARHWGYEAQVSSVAGDVPRQADPRPLAKGRLWDRELGHGIRCCATDLLATCDNERAGIVPRSLMIILMLAGDPIRYRIGATGEIVLRAGNASLIAASDAVRLASHYKAGDRCKSLVVQVGPDQLVDDDLNDAVRRRLGGTGVLPITTNARLCSLANEVCSADGDGPVTRLLAESCALELLARGLATDPNVEPVAACGQRDVANIHRVRDKLMAEPAAEHRLCDLARLAGMSVSSLKVKFPAVVGQSVFDFLRDVRLEHGRRGLEEEGWTVKQAAAFSGYAHPGNFATAYRRKYGTAPKDARHR
ncbi:MAG: helix-turn-helix transcriptional regulator [Proteobacteria bacterium]|nr:helix-turn-helix transcriptional regulator [Pseudomonadota bacterium]